MEGSKEAGSPTKRQRSDSEQERKRVKNREKQRRHKLRKATELETLRAQVAELKQQVVDSQNKIMLLEHELTLYKSHVCRHDEQLLNENLGWVAAISPYENSYAITPMVINEVRYTVKYGWWNSSEANPELFVISCGSCNGVDENVMDMLWSVYTDNFLADTVGDQFGVLNQVVTKISDYYRRVQVIYAAGNGHEKKPTVMLAEHVRVYQHPLNVILNGKHVTCADIYIQHICNDGPTVVKNTYIFHDGFFWILRCFLGHKHHLQPHYPFFPFITERGDFNLECLMGRGGLFEMENHGTHEIYKKWRELKKGNGILKN